MFKLKYQSIGIFITQYSASGAEESFKSSKFLEYPAESQTSYITSSAMMAGLIATQNTHSQAECVDRWVARHRKDEYRPVLDAMKKFPDHHPTAVILAVLGKACGSFTYLEK